jgi:dipeptidyl aminopeptidase/acylaminoacyl peptidase
LVFLFLLKSLIAQISEPYFLSSPSLTPDGQTIVFSLEGDIWKASMKDGIASRLSARQGNGNNARVSPDGKWIAFTGRQYNISDVYLMPIEGGEVEQLHFHSGSDDVSSWSWDRLPVLKLASKGEHLCGFLATISSRTTIIWWKIRLREKYFSTIPGKAATRCNASDTKDLIIRTFNTGILLIL